MSCSAVYGLTLWIGWSNKHEKGSGVSRQSNTIFFWCCSTVLPVATLTLLLLRDLQVSVSFLFLFSAFYDFKLLCLVVIFLDDCVCADTFKLVFNSKGGMDIQFSIVLRLSLKNKTLFMPSIKPIVYVIHHLTDSYQKLPFPPPPPTEPSECTCPANTEYTGQVCQNCPVNSTSSEGLDLASCQCVKGNLEIRVTSIPDKVKIYISSIDTENIEFLMCKTYLSAYHGVGFELDPDTNICSPCGLSFYAPVASRGTCTECLGDLTTLTYMEVFFHFQAYQKAFPHNTRGNRGFLTSASLFSVLLCSIGSITVDECVCPEGSNSTADPVRCQCLWVGLITFLNKHIIWY